MRIQASFILQLPMPSHRTNTSVGYVGSIDGESPDLGFFLFSFLSRVFGLAIRHGCCMKGETTLNLTCGMHCVEVKAGRASIGELLLTSG